MPLSTTALCLRQKYCTLLQLFESSYTLNYLTVHQLMENWFSVILIIIFHTKTFNGSACKCCELTHFPSNNLDNFHILVIIVRFGLLFGQNKNCEGVNFGSGWPWQHFSLFSERIRTKQSFNSENNQKINPWWRWSFLVVQTQLHLSQPQQWNSAFTWTR